MAPTLTDERPLAPIDPRIRARRAEVQRGAGRRRLQRLVDIGLVLAVVLGFVVALRSPLLDVREVVVEGAEQTDPALVLAETGIEPGMQLMDLDLRAAGERVATLPWVDDVVVHRGLDGVITVAVTERLPVALVGPATDPVAVDLEGRAVAQSTALPALPVGLVRLTGVDGLAPGEFLSPRAQAALPLLARLAEALPGTVLELSLDQLEGPLAIGGVVRFDDLTQIEAKVRSLQTIVDQVDLTCIGVIDVGSPGNPVLTREEGCS